jgi:hypothetical protein
MTDDWSSEETNDPLYADDRNFYKVEAWSQDGMHVIALLYAGNNLAKARLIFVHADKPSAGARIAAVATDASRFLRQPNKLVQSLKAASKGVAKSGARIGTR